MSEKTLRKSSKLLALAVAVLAVIVVLLVGVGRMAFSRADAGKPGSTTQIDYDTQDTRNFDLKDFSNITFIGSWKVHLDQGDAWQVELTYPKGLEEDLKVRLEGDELVLDPGNRGRHNWNWNWWGSDRNRAMTAHIVMPKLHALQITGASDMDLAGFEGDELNITISGAGNIDGSSGKYHNLNLTMSGAGNVDMRHMKFTDAQVILSGAGNVQLGMDGGELTGNLSGFGNIVYTGEVKDQRVHVSGFGRVRRKD